MQQIHLSEARKLNDFVKSRVPSWEVGKPFDANILDEYKQRIDIKA